LAGDGVDENTDNILGDILVVMPRLAFPFTPNSAGFLSRRVTESNNARQSLSLPGVVDAFWDRLSEKSTSS
jgi:hypothetical protein